MIEIQYKGNIRGLFKVIGEEICEFCLGEGEVSTDERDRDGNWERGVGTQRCICQLSEPDYGDE